MRRAPLFLLATLAPLACAGSAADSPATPRAEAPPGLHAPGEPSGVEVVAREESYEVTGSTAAELDAAMQRNGPGSGENGLPGAHRWHVDFEMPPAAGRECAVPRARVVLHSTITVPRWVDREAADPALVKKWDAFLAALWRHEYGHRAIAYDAAGEVRRVLERFEGRPCAAVVRALESAVDAAVARYRERDRAYDAETMAGYREGVVWPPL